MVLIARCFIFTPMIRCNAPEPRKSETRLYLMLRNIRPIRANSQAVIQLSVDYCFLIGIFHSSIEYA